LSPNIALFWPEEPVNMPDEPHLRWDHVNDRSLGWSQIVGPVEKEREEFIRHEFQDFILVTRSA
jgi:hypothetical protein